MHEFSELCFAEHENGTHNADCKIGAEESSVIEEGIEIFTHSVGCPLSPDYYTGDEVANKS